MLMCPYCKDEGQMFQIRAREVNTHVVYCNDQDYHVKSTDQVDSEWVEIVCYACECVVDKEDAEKTCEEHYRALEVPYVDPSID